MGRVLQMGKLILGVSIALSFALAMPADIAMAKTGKSGDQHKWVKAYAAKKLAIQCNNKFGGFDRYVKIYTNAEREEKNRLDGKVNSEFGDFFARNKNYGFIYVGRANQKEYCRIMLPSRKEWGW